MIPTFDIECAGWTNPVAVGFFDGEKYIDFIRESEEDDVIWRFLSYIKDIYKGMTVYAHCAAKFDNKFILSNLYNHDEIISPQAGLIKLRWVGPEIFFEDSYLLLPMSLRKLTDIFELQKKKKEWAHESTRVPWEMGTELGAFREYLRRDCLALSECLDQFSSLLEDHFNILPSVSLSTTSIKAFSKNFFSLDKVDSNEPFDHFIREATYGGRNEVYRRYGEKINCYDVNWMYISCYDAPMPYGRLSWIRPNIDRGSLAEAKVKVPKDFYIGPLPYRFNGLLTFPVGEFSSWWDTEELRLAASLGVDITIKRQLCCEESPILEDFGKYMGILRDQKGELRELWKLFGISLSGKFGQSRFRDNTKVSTEITDFSGWTPLDPQEIYFTKREYMGGRLPHIKPAIAMRVRASARIRHYKMLERARQEGKIYYADTDSIYTTATLPIGTEIGELSFLGKIDRGYFIKQKLYGIITRGKLKQRSAGFTDLKLTEEDFKGLLEGKEIERREEVLPNIRRILKGNEISLLTKRRLINGKISNSRIAEGLETRPLVFPLNPPPDSGESLVVPPLQEIV